MSQIRHKRLIDLFTEAVELPPLEREVYINQMCGDDGKLRSELENLLRCDPDASVILNEIPTADLIRDAASQVFEERHLNNEDLAYSKEFAGYVIQRELGSGSMGRVFLARQISTGQQVALKIIRDRFYSPKIIRRFEFEVEVLARLEHPGIARIFDAGTANVDGQDQPYFAMEYLPGATLLDYARDRKLDLNARIELMASICEAVHHAHQQGVIHRDLKPENILVTEDGRPKVLDFGVARIVDADIQLTTIGQDMGQIIGTLRYMSPEQAAGDTAKLDTRSDVYALGVVAFELISGKPPYDLDEGSLLSAVRIIQENDPRRLVCGNISTPSDVETIIAKALEKEKDRRYASAMELAADFRRFLAFEPISARPDSAFYQIRKYARRHRILAGSLIAILIISIVSLGVSLHYMTRALSANEEAQWQLYISRILGAAAELQDNGLRAAQEFLEESPPEFRRWEWRYLANRSDQSIAALDRHMDYAWCVAVAPDGSRAFVGEGNSPMGRSQLRVWDLVNNNEITTLPVHDSRVQAVACSFDGTRIASGSLDHTIHLLDAENFDTVAILGDHQSGVSALSFSPTDGLLASGAEDGSLRLWDAQTGSPIRTLKGHQSKIFSICFSPSGDRLFSGSADGSVKIWEVATGIEIASQDFDAGSVIGVSFEPNTGYLAIGTILGKLEIWDVERQLSIASLTLAALDDVPSHSKEFGLIGSVAYSPDGEYLAATSANNEIWIWKVGEWESEPFKLLGHTAEVRSLTWTPDSSRLLSASWDNTVRIWDANRIEERVAPFEQTGAEFFGFNHTSTSLIVADEAGTLGIVSTWTGGIESHLFPIPDFDKRTTVLSNSKAGHLAVAWLPMPDSHFSVWNTHSGDKLFSGKGGFAKAFSVDGKKFAAETIDHVIALYAMQGEEPVTTLKGVGKRVNSIAFSPDGTLLAMAGYGYSVLVWDLGSLELVASLDKHRNITVHVVFNSTGTRLATSGVDGMTRIWDTASFAQLASLPSTGQARAAAFHPTEPRLATLSSDGSVRIWSSESYEKLLQIREGGGGYDDLQFSPDGCLLVLSAKKEARMVVLDGR
ncbi:MAG: protein kinase [Planctomycetes bacterium]|nr:protein kinase [Planctomycetota bacterium]